MTDTHAPRLSQAKIYAAATPVFNAMGEIAKAVAASTLEHDLVELVKLRASQINGCAYCVQMHATDARKMGVSEDRLQLLVVWREAPVFSPRERAAFAWTEALTRLSDGPVSDALYEEVAGIFSDSELAHLTAAVALINAYNRFGAPFLYKPAIHRAAT